MDLKKISVTMSYILRHGAIKMGVPITKDGYIKLSTLAETVAAMHAGVTEEHIRQIVAEDKKGRYTITTDQDIRANQGHSMELDIQFQKLVPPAVLYHGTATKNALSIGQSGIESRARHHVHLSDNAATAWEVGARHGTPMILVIDAMAMWTDGIDFFLSENGVWLTAAVDPKYITDMQFSLEQ